MSVDRLAAAFSKIADGISHEPACIIRAFDGDLSPTCTCRDREARVLRALAELTLNAHNATRTLFGPRDSFVIYLETASGVERLARHPGRDEMKSAKKMPQEQADLSEGQGWKDAALAAREQNMADFYGRLLVALRGGSVPAEPTWATIVGVRGVERHAIIGALGHVVVELDDGRRAILSRDVAPQLLAAIAASDIPSGAHLLDEGTDTP